MAPLLSLLALLASLARAGTLEVDVLDVGQGDAILIRTPAGKTVLIDAGQGEASVPALLAARKVEHLDLVVGTHAHADHIGGMDEVVGALPVRNYLDNGLPHTTQTYAKLMQAVEAEAIPYRTATAGQVFNLDDGAKIEVLFPTEAPLRNTRSDLNSNSVVLRLTHQGHCMLFVGDSEAPTEDALVSRGITPCEVLKVAHHGSNHSSTARFLAAVKPRHALISVGESNRYGHPGEETLERLAAAGATVHRTDQLGTITVRSSEDGLTITGEKKPDEPAVVAAAAAPESTETHGATAAEPKNLVPAPPVDIPQPACPFPASAASQVFHEAGCGNANKILPSNLVCYANRDGAVAAGRRSAGCCKP